MQEQRALGNILVRHGVLAEGALEPCYAQQREKASGSGFSVHNGRL